MQRCPNAKWEEAAPSPSRVCQRSGNSSKATGGGEIVEVQGGHIVRSTSRKDRHSKVCTARGPRDRRVRLAAHTAIQFYDVQDRLGYDRPSKAVDWLISKAKSAIDQLAQLPPWHPVGGCDGGPNRGHGKKIRGGGSVCNRASSDLNAQDSNFLPLQLDNNSDAIADEVKSFFPLGDAVAAAADDSSSCPDDVQFHSFQSQDLNLSLQSFQDSIYDASNLTAWLDQSNQRLLQSWNYDHHNNNNNVVNGDIFLPPTVSQPLVQENGSVLNQLVFTTQRGPLQSSYSTPSAHAWADQFATIDHRHHGFVVPVYPPPTVPEVGFAYSGTNGCPPGFHMPPARIEGDGEEC